MNLTASRRRDLLYLTFSLLVLTLFLLAARSTFQASRANDTTSAYYLSYARNLNRLPVSQTRLLNIDAVAPEGKPIFQDARAGFYQDHPPLLTWAVAVALKAKEMVARSVPDLIAARMVSIVASMAILLMTMRFCLRDFGIRPALISGVAIVSCPVFFSHGVVVNFEPLCCSLILLGFTGNSPLFFLPSFLADWPAFFALPVYSLKEWQKGNRGSAAWALGLAVVTGCAIILLSGYLAGARDLGVGFVSTVVSSEAGHYVNKSGSELLERTGKILALVLHNFGPLNLIVLLVAAISWFRRLKSLNQAQTVAVASVAAAFFNTVLFPTWAAEHSFWSYYLLPAVAIAYADLATARNLKLFVLLCLAAASYHSAVKYRELLVEYPWSSAEGKCSILLASGDYPLFTDTRHAYFGHGYVARWYFDRPLHYAASPSDPSVEALCSTRTCIWLSENGYVRLPAEKFRIYQVGSFANVHLTMFRVKQNRGGEAESF